MQFLVFMVSTWSSVLIVASVPVRGTGIGADLCEQVIVDTQYKNQFDEQLLVKQVWLDRTMACLRLLTVLHTT